MPNRQKLQPELALDVIGPLVEGGETALYRLLSARASGQCDDKTICAAADTLGDEKPSDTDRAPQEAQHNVRIMPARAAPAEIGARIDPAVWYAIAQVTQVLPWTARTLEAWRAAGKGPAWSRVGGRILYRGDDLLKFLEAGRRPDAEERRALRTRR